MQKNEGPMTVNVCNPYVPSGDYSLTLAKLLGVMQRHLTDKEMNQLIENKLQLGRADADEAQYIQAACELTVCAFFAYHNPETFLYEPKLNGRKDVDCSFERSGIKVNVEIKCADFTKLIEHRQRDVFSVHVGGQLDGFRELAENLNGLLSEMPDGKEVVLAPHQANNLKDFLESAHSKFPEVPGENELNVLVVCCDDEFDAGKWWHYMFGPKGLLTPTSYSDTSKYSRVDVVVLTNLFHRHHAIGDKPRLVDHWDFGQAFNLALLNHSRTQSKEHLEANFLGMLNTYNHAFVKFTQELDPIEQPLMVSLFAKECLYEKNVFPFQPFHHSSKE